VGWSSGVGSFCGNDKQEDLIHHFPKYFKQRLDPSPATMHRIPVPFAEINLSRIALPPFLYPALPCLE